MVSTFHFHLSGGSHVRHRDLRGGVRSVPGGGVDLHPAQAQQLRVEASGVVLRWRRRSIGRSMDMWNAAGQNERWFWLLLVVVWCSCSPVLLLYTGRSLLSPQVSNFTYICSLVLYVAE